MIYYNLMKAFPGLKLMKKARIKERNGYWAIRYIHPVTKAVIHALEHRVVMAEMLGRPVEPHEQVHHRNGDKGDNRPINLELWTTSQPPGRRDTEEVLARYGRGVS